MLFQLLSGPGWQAKKKKSNTIPCLGQVLTCLGQRQVKLHTLFRTARLKNHTLSSGTSPYSPNKGVPPPGPIHGSRKLQVTILASEWESTKGGLSTINRELAIQLAKFSYVEVTFFLPKCSHEDKKAAESHDISILEATRRPGYDELDWLSFAPKHLS